jgi:DeoR/GlpR family transcriptional regulator of sugar metabolism
VNALLAKREQGAAIKELVEEFKVSRATVHRYLKEGGVKRYGKTQRPAPTGGAKGLNP